VRSAIENASGGMGFYTKSHDDRFGYSNDIKVITLTISEAVMLVLLAGGICELYR
jgi:hypothetical protein